MSYNILGITPGHNGSVALVSDGKLIYYLEEERLSRLKYDSSPLKTILSLLPKYKINEIAVTGVSKHFIPFSPPPPVVQTLYSHLIEKYQERPKTTEFWEWHHLSHASNTFYNSGFNKSAVLVIDTAGSSHKEKENGDYHIEETESIFSFEYPNIWNLYYKSYNNHDNLNFIDREIHVSSNSNLGKVYEGITQLFGWTPHEAGKTMGLSSYGNLNPNIPPLFVNGKGNPKYFKSVYGTGAEAYFNLSKDPKEWHYDATKITQYEKDLAYHIQYESEKEVFKLVEKALDLTKLDKIACAGGYFLNCVCNYKLLKKFPNIKFYFDPVSHDGGNSVGAALYRWYEYSGDTTIRPRKTLYNGPQYTQDQLINSIKKYAN